MKEDLHAFLRSRRSIRHFLPDPVPGEVLRRILETAAYAPSAHNGQPWRFAILTADASKSRLSGAMATEFQRDLENDGLPGKEISTRIERSRRRIMEAPVVIVLCMDETGMDSYPDAERRRAETTMAVQSTALAGLQLLLAAHAEGLAGVWTCGPLFAPAVVCQALDLPSVWQPQAMILLGFPAESAKEKQLRPLDDVVRSII
jgi:F420 biosynthesis protein FbiB-like protein